MKSKEEKVIELFYQQPTREWHFEEILKEASITRSKVTNWLNSFQKEHLIRRIKPNRKMPYYIGHHESPAYRNKKRLFAMQKLYDSGLLNHLLSIEKVRAVILFGSYSRSDWNVDSDIDIFVYGNLNELNIYKYEKKLGKEIEIFPCENPKDLRKFGKGFVKNILRGNVLKGDLDFLDEWLAL